MSHRRQGGSSRANRRQGDPNFILEDFSGASQGPGGHSGAPQGKDGRSKIPGPVKDHRGKARGPKSKGKNSRSPGGAESPEESQGGRRRGKGSPRPQEPLVGASPSRGPLTNGVKSSGETEPQVEPPVPCNTDVEPLREPSEPELEPNGVESLDVTGDSSVNPAIGLNAKESEPLFTLVTDESEPFEQVTDVAEPFEKTAECVGDKDAKDKDSVRDLMEGKVSCDKKFDELDKTLKDTVVGGEPVKMDLAEAKEPEGHHIEPSLKVDIKESFKGPKSLSLKEPEGIDSETFTHIEINYMDPVKQLHTIVEESKEPDDKAEMKMDEEEELKIPTELGHAPSKSARERQTKIPGLLKEPKSRGSGNKNLRVTFDLSTTHERDEDVIENWEDLSDTDGGDLVIDEDDIIDCSTSKLTTMDELLDFSEDVHDDDQLMGIMGPKDEENLQWFRPSVEYTVEPAKMPDKGDDVRTVDKSMSTEEKEKEEEKEDTKEKEKKQGERQRTFVNAPIFGADIIPLSISVYNNGNNSHHIPFIDGEEETCVDDDDDDDWETEPSGSSGENGDSEKVDDLRGKEKKEDDPGLPNKVEEEDNNVINISETGGGNEDKLKIVDSKDQMLVDSGKDEEKMVDSKEEEKIIDRKEEKVIDSKEEEKMTDSNEKDSKENESIDIKEKEKMVDRAEDKEEVDSKEDEGNIDEKKIEEDQDKALLRDNTQDQEKKVESIEDKEEIGDNEEQEVDTKDDKELIETNKEEVRDTQDIREEEDEKTLVDQPSLEDDYSEENDDLVTKEDIDVVFMALEKHSDEGAAPLARPEILSPLSARSTPLQKTQSSVLVGPMPRPEQIPAWDRPGSPQVSVGYECHERKAPSICGSETESEGEFVPCEDKCIGTADFAMESDSEPLDLSTSSSNERTSSICDTVSSLSRDTAELTGSEAIPGDQGTQVSLAPDADGHTEGAKGDTSSLTVSNASSDNTSSSPEPKDEANCLGKSESGKEKEMNGKKVVKKKGKKNKRETALEPAPVPEHILGRPKLVRGRTWKEKREKFKQECDDPLSLSFGKELCESEIVEGTTNIPEVCSEASLERSPECSTETTTLITVSPGIDSPSGIGEQTTPDSLVDNPTASLSEVEDAALWISRNIVPPPPEVAIEVTAASDEENVPEKEDFYIVRTSEAEKPLEASKEYVGDSESSEEAAHLPQSQVVPRDVWATGTPLIGISLDGSQLGKTKDTSDSPVDSSDNSAYTDAKDSSCAESLPHSFDYVQSFPEVIGTQSLNLVYTYDTDSDFNSKPDRWSSRSKDTSTISRVVGELEEDEPDVAAGDIVYEGPCSCGPGKPRMGPLLPPYLPPRTDVGMGVGSNDSPLCVPPPTESDHDDVFSDDAMKLVVDSLVNEDSETALQDAADDEAGEHEANGNDIRSRIKEIVGPRLQRERGRQTMRGGRDEGDREVDEHLLTSGESPRRGREESPLPGSSPASSSGVQGSDEMSLSRSRSRSPACKDPRASKNFPAPYAVPDMSFEAFPTQEMTPDKMDPADTMRALRFEGGMDSSPEKTPQVDCSFSTFRDMYQINPVYLTDSDDPEYPTESDTIVPGSGSGYDLDRSITVNSWGSTSEESPLPQELSSSPPLPGGRGAKKVPKVTKLLRETQGIVQRWEVLQAQAVERQRQSGQVRELQRQVKSMRVVLESLIERANDTTQVEDLETHHQLNDKLQELKDLQQEVMTRKGEVSSVNLAVHRFMTETGYSVAHLKDEVADLYRLWDEAHKRSSSELSRLEGVEATWKLWETQAEELRRALRKDGDTLKVLDAAIQTGSLTDTVTASMQDVERLLNDRRKSQPGKRLTLQHTRTQGVDIQGSTTSLGASGDECLSDSGTSGYESCSSEELSERERRLAHLRRLARDLEASLHPNSQAWMDITKTLSSAESELKDLQKHCRDLVVRSAESLEQTKTSPQLRRRSWTKDAKSSRTGRLERRGHCALSGRDGCGRSVSSGRRGWMWRVVRAALPFQAALLLLFCVACLLEPNCCDHVNTLNLSLSPQLRYVHGPPPV